MTKAFQHIIDKTEVFIKAYYRNKIFKGTIVSFSLILILFLTINLVEYFSWLSSNIRTVIFYGYLGLTSCIFLYQIVLPLIKLFKIGKVLSYKQAAKIIGTHLPEVNDKLLNAIELGQNNFKENNYSTELILAGIEQKYSELNIVPFVKAVEWKSSYKKLKYLFTPIIIIILLLAFRPALIVQPSERIIAHNTFFQKPLPFIFTLLNKKLIALQNDDFTVIVSFNGEEIPKKIFLNDGENSFLMHKNAKGNFEYTLKTLQRDKDFYIETNQFKSPKFYLKVFPKPIIFNFDVKINYPEYLDKKTEKIENSSELVVPEGSLLSIKIYTRDVNLVYLKTSDNKIDTLTGTGNVFRYRKEFTESERDAYFAKNIYTDTVDSLFINVKVIKDEYPTINIIESKDDEHLGLVNFNGEIRDDYGFHSLKFYYKKDKDKIWKNFKLQIRKKTTALSFGYEINTLDLNLSSGERIAWYFAVRDNDEIHHFKETKTAINFIEIPSDVTLRKDIDSTSDELKNKFQLALNKIRELNKSIEANKLNLLYKKKLNWMDEERLKNLMKAEINIQEQIKELNQLQNKVRELENFKKQQPDANLQEKLKELKKLFNSMRDPELMKKLQKAKKDIEKLDKNQLNKLLNDIKEKNLGLEKNLAQNDELYKQMEFEKKLTETLQKLDSLAKNQLSEAKKNEKKKVNKKDALKKQKQFDKKYNDIKKDLKKAMELNKQLEKPLPVKRDSTLEKSITNDMKEATEKLNKSKPKKASSAQKGAGGKMKKMKDALESAFKMAMESRIGEDAENMKRLLDNLVQLSFKQENLMGLIKKGSKNDPKYVDNINSLQQIREDFNIIDDSLQTLSKRNIFIRPFILKQSNSIKNSLNRASTSMQDRHVSSALKQQQYAMTYMNNLALLMEESLEKMQQSMMNMKSQSQGGKSCPNPGKGQGKSLSEIIQMQQGLNKLINKNSNKKGKQKNGKNGENGDSEQLARMAALQQQIREMLQEMMDQLKSQGGNGNAMNEILKEMQKTEKDIVNRNINRKTLERQRNIEVRLLKAENARLERENQQKRESREGKNIKRSNLQNKLKYKTTTKIKKDIIITNPVRLNPFYRNLHNKYINKLEKQHDKSN